MPIFWAKWHKVVGEIRNCVGEMTQVVEEMTQVVEEIKQICWGSDTKSVGEMPQIQSEITPSPSPSPSPSSSSSLSQLPTLPPTTLNSFVKSIRIGKNKVKKESQWNAHNLPWTSFHQQLYQITQQQPPTSVTSPSPRSSWSSLLSTWRMRNPRIFFPLTTSTKTVTTTAATWTFCYVTNVSQ